MQSANKREVCYEKRDQHFKCLDGLPEDPAVECAVTNKALVEACPPSWVTYFHKQRDREVMLQFQLESARPLK